MSRGFYSVTFDDAAADRRPNDAEALVDYGRRARFVDLDYALLEMHLYAARDVEAFNDAAIALGRFDYVDYPSSPRSRAGAALPPPHKFTEDPRLRACKPARGAAQPYHRRHGKDNRS